MNNKSDNLKSIILILFGVIIVFIVVMCWKSISRDHEDDPFTPEFPVSADIPVSSEENKVLRPAEELIDLIITAYTPDNGRDTDEIFSLFEELSEVDSNKAILWKCAMEYWDYLRFEMILNRDTVPENLPDGNNLCIVVLGYQLNDDGSMRDELIGRLETALLCANTYENAYVLCTGGGTAANNPSVTEAGAMGEWLKENGVSQERIIIEDRSLSTVDNAVYSRDIILNQYDEIDSVIIVTSDYHVARGMVLFETAFMDSYMRRDAREIHVVSNCAYTTEDYDTKMLNEIQIHANNLSYLADKIK